MITGLGIDLEMSKTYDIKSCKEAKMIIVVTCQVIYVKLLNQSTIGKLTSPSVVISLSLDHGIQIQLLWEDVRLCPKGKTLIIETELNS